MTAPLTVAHDEPAALVFDTRAPGAQESLTRLSVLAARLEHALDVLEPTLALAQQAPLMIATAVDTFDALVAEGREHGIDVDERLRAGLRLLERVSAPDTMRALNTLLDRLPTLAALAPMVDQAPALLADARRTARPLGLLGTLGALRDPNVQAAVGLAVSAARLVGQQASTPNRGHSA
jgi:uncharacterized protein YjgD (DUF1641 family)